MGMYKSLRKSQHSFFSSAKDVLKYYPGFSIEENNHGLMVFKIDGNFVASVNPGELEDALIYYGNRQVIRDNKK